MSMLAEQYEFVIGGDPDRDTVDLAVVDSATGALRAHLADRADGAGYARMLAWADSHAPGRRVWALEGTGSFAAGLAVFLSASDPGQPHEGHQRAEGSDRGRTRAAAFGLAGLLAGQAA
jgi:transposase